jgi:type III restriction enzyme
MMAEGLAGTTTEDSDNTSSTGDVIAAELRDGFEQYDFAIPHISREEESFLEHHTPDLAALPTFTAMTLAQLAGLLGKGDTFISQDLQSSTLFGDYRVEGAVMNVSGYNDFLARLTRRISQALSQPLPKGNKTATHLASPYLQANTAELTGWLDGYIRGYLFGETFNPMEGENWRVLLLQPVIDHISKVLAVALIESQHQDVVGETEVRLSQLIRSPKADDAREQLAASHQMHLRTVAIPRTQWWT